MYKTDFLKIKNQILQTILAQIPRKAKKIDMIVRLDDQKIFNKFKQLQAQRVDQDLEQYAKIESSEEEDNDQYDKKLVQQSLKQELASSLTNQNPKKQKQNKDSINIKKIPSNEKPTLTQKRNLQLQQSIILKQFYQSQFKEIGQKYNVKINIRALKISFEGVQIEDIEDAMEEIDDIIMPIQVYYVGKYGLEMYQSRSIKAKLQKVGVHIFGILDKYYRWWDIKTNEPQLKRQRKCEIENTLKEIDQNCHSLQYLYNIDEQISLINGSQKNDLMKARQKFMTYRPLLQELKAKIFQNQLQYKINESQDDEEIDVELSQHRDALVFHSKANQYLQMTIKQTREQFRNFDYFFLTINTAESSQIIEESIKILSLNEYKHEQQLQESKNTFVIGEIQEVKQQKYIHFTHNYEKIKRGVKEKSQNPAYLDIDKPRYQGIVFCIGFKRKIPEQRNQYLCEIVQRLHLLWKDLSYKISICLDRSEQLQSNFLTYEFNLNEKIFHMTANQITLQSNLKIFKDYVIHKKLDPKKKLMNQTIDYDLNDTTINLSQQIPDSTYLLQKSISMSKDMLNNSSILQKVNQQESNYYKRNQKQQGLQEQDLQCMRFLQRYSVFLEETNKEYNEKYKNSDIEQNVIVRTDKKNRSLQDQLAKISKSKFYVYKIQLNPKHKVQQFYSKPKQDQIITVFLSGKYSPFIKDKNNESTGLKIEQNIIPSFPIRLFGFNNKQILQNGYLINIKKQKIEILGKQYRIKYETEFEVAKEILCLNIN